MNGLIVALIVCNEFCERFCYYGLRSLLFSFMRSEYNFSVKQATLVLHVFISLSTFCSIFGGLLSDMFIGRYKTILYLSAIYFTGTSLLTYSSMVLGSYKLVLFSLLLISLGTGGIKPCVAAFGGDQFDKKNTKDLNMFFNIFYFTINFGGMLSTIIVPMASSYGCLDRKTCYPMAFGISSFLLGSSIILFVMGTEEYVIKPPSNKSILLIFKALFRKKDEKNENKNITPSEEIHKFNNNDNTNVIIKILKIFAPVTFFWMLYDQLSSSWVEQGNQMKTESFVFAKKFEILSSQMQAFNSLFIIIFIPLFSKTIYPKLEKIGIKLSPVEKIGGGLFLGSLSFFFSSFLEFRIKSASLNHEKISILWQLPQYILLTAGEIMLNMTGLEFAYSEAPENMKSIILSLWLLTSTIGNLFVIVFSCLDITRKFSYFDHEIYNFLVYGIIGLVASRYVLKMKHLVENKN